jgi:CRISPR/Cas system-associated exonuclease Cas4 (RecB family)
MTDDRVKISWSSLQRWELCKQKQHLVSQGLTLPGKDVRNFLAGNVVDSIQKTWLDNPVGKMSDMVAEHMEKAIAKAEEKNSIKWRNKNDKSNIFKSCFEATVALQPILEARVLPYDYEPGKWFTQVVNIKDQNTGEVKEIILRGEFDLLVKEPDGFVVWDLKTTKDNDYWKKTVGQLVFYDLVIMSMFNEYPKKTGLIQPLCDEQVKEFYFDNTHRAEIWARISAFAHSEWAQDYTPKKDNDGCSFCEVVSICAKFKRKTLIRR